MLLSIKEYADRCGCTVPNIRSRIKNKLIKLKINTFPVKIKIAFIDASKYHPVRIRKNGGGRKKVVKSTSRKIKKAA